ncbi:hypothetical protein DACRYDRAFT_59950 [Dacryopinax primogenitus]|uniref:Uncharacterized protein n=1 Tax=Dacryopinax primogenitus (strain DJM 731) TaxID=1858805 RepID=M5FUQ1_DACPD|nr:uncharacterized protein DACRYDRAFT_59950 [Dacryopinax primogenitus]EJT96996.1 hypothetical protein DACRYDRAFT_59950 [Dacryopinax primogenitus]
MSHPTPSADEIEELLLSCRYGDLEDVRAFVEKFGAAAAAEARDDRGSNVLHMCAANGHEDVLSYLLPLMPPSLLTTPNTSLSLPVHWAALNRHLPILAILVSDTRIDGAHLIALPNGSGKSSLTVAEEEGWDEGASWLADKIELALAVGEGETAEGVEEEDVGEEPAEGEKMDVDVQK